MKLTEVDRRQFANLRARGILISLAPTDIPRHDGVIAVACPDCDQYHDLEPRLAEISRTMKGHSRPHIFKLNGGALLLSVEGFNRTHRRDEVLIEDIQEAQEMKGIEVIIPTAHAPCGKAYGAALDLDTVVERLIEAETVLRVRLTRGTPIFPLLHMDFGGGPSNKDLFRINRRAWNEYDRRGY